LPITLSARSRLNSIGSMLTGLLSGSGKFAGAARLDPVEQHLIDPACGRPPQPLA